MTEREIDQKDKRPDAKTTSVPFPLTENEENITLNTNTSSKLSKEQIINQAFKFHSQGNTPKASKYYKYFINKVFKDPRVFSIEGYSKIPIKKY